MLPILLSNLKIQLSHYVYSTERKKQPTNTEMLKQET